MFRGNVPGAGEVIAESRGWVLIELGETAGWRNLKLCSKTERSKGNFWLAWNGERLSMSSDAGKLDAQHPDVFDWVCEAMGRR